MGTKDVLVDHDWPRGDEHLFTKWQAKTQSIQYRYCLHPKCSATEERPAPIVRGG